METITRNEIIERLKKYFDIRELVCPHTYKKFGDKSWMFLSTEILHTLLVLRTVILDVPLICNNYMIQGGTLSQRGLRCNLCSLVKEKTENGILYLTAHMNGCGLDLTSTYMSAKEMQARIKKNIDKLPYGIRMEMLTDKVNWLHIDCYHYGDDKIVMFNG